MHCQPGGRRIAYGGADGEVAVVGLERDMAAQPHSVLAGACSHMLSPSPSCSERPPPPPARGVPGKMLNRMEMQERPKLSMAE